MIYRFRDGYKLEAESEEKLIRSLRSIDWSNKQNEPFMVWAYRYYKRLKIVGYNVRLFRVINKKTIVKELLSSGYLAEER